jgi:hypothetical protein
MLKKNVTLILVIGLLNLFFVSTAMGETKEEAKRAATAEKVKAGIAKLGTGPDAKVEIKLYDKTKLKGYVSKADSESFVVIDAKTAVETVVAYNNVKQVKGNNLSGGVKLLIGIGLIIALAIVIASQTK